MYDFYEFLSRGIIAERTGRPKEAIKHLVIAAKIAPDNPRLWLWLASSVETLAQKRQCLEQALKLDPNLVVAKTLLDRLSQDETIIYQRGHDFVFFTCPYCGGKQYFDPDVHSLVCNYCQRAELLILENAFEAEQCLPTALSKNADNWAVMNSQISCEACGAKLSILAEQSKHACPFCGSEHITVQPATPNLISPTAVIPFQYHSEDVIELLGKLWGLSTTHVKRLCNTTNKLSLASIYLPFWTFDGTVQIRCLLERRIIPRIYSENERVIRKDDDLPETNGWFEYDIDDLLVYAGCSFSSKVMEKNSSFDLKSALSYRPEVLVGWQAELYQVALGDAAIVAHKRMRDLAFKKAARRGLFMNPQQLLADEVRIVNPTYKLVLLPLWIARQSKQGEVVKTYINGQSGKVVGKRKQRGSRLPGFLPNL